MNEYHQTAFPPFQLACKVSLSKRDVDFGIIVTELEVSSLAWKGISVNDVLVPWHQFHVDGLFLIIAF